MKKNLIAMFALSVAMPALVAVANAQEQLPEPEGKAFWTYISQTHPYIDWQMWPGKDGMYPGTSPHGAYLKLYINDVALNAVKEKKPMPDGAIIVKENYGDDREKLMAVTPMYKKQGYNPEGGDWFWAKYGPDGEVETSGKVEGCIQCHKSAENWLFTKSE